MPFRLMLGLSWRELMRALSKLRWVAFILLIGFIGPFFSTSIRSSVDRYLREGSRKILSSDLAISSFKVFEEPTRLEIRNRLKPVRMVEETEFVTMARGRDVSTLVEIHGVDGDFPIYGGFRFAGSLVTTDASNLQPGEAWVFPEVLAQLGLKQGDEIGIGRTSFRITRVLEDGPGRGRAGFLAPRVYVQKTAVEGTGLIQLGSQIFYRIYLQLPAGVDPEKLTFIHKDPDIFIRTPDDAIQGFERFFNFFNLYLVSVSMIIFVLSWIAAFYILQVYLQERLRNAAVLMVNGAGRVATAALYSWQIFLLIAAAFVAAGLSAEVLSAIINRVLSDRLPEGFVLALSLRDWSILAAVAAVSALAFNTPFFIRLHRLKLQTLLGESALGQERLPTTTALLTYGPLLVIFLALSAWLMGSFSQASRLSGGMALAAVGGWFAGRVLFRAFFAAVRTRPGLTRLIATSLSRSRFGVNLCFLALVLVSLAMNLVPHMLTSVISEIQPLQGREVPGLFLFNIPESELGNLKSVAAKNAFELRYLSPMILGRLKVVNGHDPKDEAFRRFPVRLSYRHERIPSETIIKGRDFKGAFDPASGALPEISVEERYAERNGFQLGDKIEFDIQGLPFTAEVTSLRRVRWTSFNPNFFIMFQPGVLDDAPKTWIANVNFPTDNDSEAGKRKVATQYLLTRDFPDVTIIDIGRTLAQVLEVARSVIGPVRAAAWAAVAMSFLILIGIIAHNLKLRESEVDIEKLLGADASFIRALLTGEYSLTAGFAWLVGAGSALAIAWAVVRLLLDIRLSFSWWALGFSAFIVIATTMVITWLTATRVLNLRGSSKKL